MGINQHNSEWTNEIEKRLVELRNSGMTFDEVTQHLNQEFNFKVPRTVARVKAKYYRIKDKNFDDIQAEVNYKETVEILEDGTHKSDKLLRMNAEQSKSPEYLLKAHGYDVDQWTLVSARNNIWNVYSKQDGVQTLYSSKITVRPKKDEFSLTDLVEYMAELEPVKIERTPITSTGLLEIPIYDPHFPISTYDDYIESQSKILNKIESKDWEQILITLGSDMLHHDNMRSTTANGTPIQQVDIIQGWEYARQFFEPIIESAIKHSKICKVIYVPGNHDESLSWAFTQMIKARYPQAIYDTNVEQWKIHTYGNTVIGFTHGDKARKDLHNVFMANFPNEWGEATNREIHCGHIHIEEVRDYYGTMVRSLSTRNKTDKWHKQNGFLGAHKRFQLFEYSREGLESIHYV